MAKYKVHCYYEFVGIVEVEADSIEDAFEKGIELCADMSVDDLRYVGPTDSEVIDTDGEVHVIK